MKTYYEINTSGINELTESTFRQTYNESQHLYLMDVLVEDRHDLYDELKDFDIKKEILQYAQDPSQHIRFETIDEITYGELAFFREEPAPSMEFIGIIASNNLLVLIHLKNENLTAEIARQVTDAIQHAKTTVDLGFLLYTIIHEILTKYAQNILSYREEIEEFGRGLIDNPNEVNPDDFLASKTRLSSFSQVFEKLYFTLNFPPVKSLVDIDSPYQAYFNDLLKTTDILKQSLEKAEDRLNSLHAHYLLTIQEKSNKRINFLTIIQAIFVPLTLFAGIYGMNFDYIPELKFRYAYFVFLGAMVIIAAGFLRYFYKNGWFD